MKMTESSSSKNPVNQPTENETEEISHKFRFPITTFIIATAIGLLAGYLYYGTLTWWVLFYALVFVLPLLVITLIIAGIGSLTLVKKYGVIVGIIFELSIFIIPIALAGLGFSSEHPAFYLVFAPWFITVPIFALLLGRKSIAKGSCLTFVFMITTIVILGIGFFAFAWSKTSEKDKEMTIDQIKCELFNSYADCWTSEDYENYLYSDN